jgi:hypothetical protein
MRTPLHQPKKKPENKTLNFWMFWRIHTREK